MPTYRRGLDQVHLLLEDVAVTEVIMDDRDMELVSEYAYLHICICAKKLPIKS